MPTIEYAATGATERKYVNDVKAVVTTNKDWWYIGDTHIVASSIISSWIPDLYDPPFIYAWGNKWVPAEVKPSVEYRVPGATQYKFMPELVTLTPQDDMWTKSTNPQWADFDYTWRPDPHSPPYIYQWADSGPVYRCPDATEAVLVASSKAVDISKYYIKTTLEALIAEHPDEVFWALNPDLKYENFDFTWRPDGNNFRHINVFGNSLSKDTATYYVNGPMYTLGYRDYNYVSNQKMDVDTNLSMFYVDTGNGGPDSRWQQLKERYPQLQRTRFVNSWVDTINRCIKKSETKLLWILSSCLDYSDFRFDFYPAKWQIGMTHVFGTQWSHWGNTYLVNSQTFPVDSQHIQAVEHIKGINHVRGTRAKTAVCQHDILYIKFPGVDDTGASTTLESTGRKVYTVDYSGSYLQTIKEFIASNPGVMAKQDPHMWITSSICDYSGFDFTWSGDPFQSEQVQVFPSKLGNTVQQQGDTFLVNIHCLGGEIESLADLASYTLGVNYLYTTANRRVHPVVKHRHDSQVDAVRGLDVPPWPYYELQCGDAPEAPDIVPSVWDSTKQPVVVGSTGASLIIVPHSALGKIKGEIYDWPWIEAHSRQAKSTPLDIAFISNGEPGAEENWNHLQKVLKAAGCSNRLYRVQDVSGRVASQHAAAEASQTDWYFLVNAKLKVDPKFNWGWQPDRLQQGKHYIFMAENPVNGLVYGHQAIVANNRRLTLNTAVSGLDFTMDSLHAVVDVLSGVAHYNSDEWTTWRTAFREAIKLRHNGDKASMDRLAVWCSPGSGEFAGISQLGALDGVEYWESAGGSLDSLMNTYDWGWIHEYYKDKYG